MDKIEKILSQLVESTQCGALEWTLRDTCFNSETRHHYQSKSIDEKTSFEIEISLTAKLDAIGYRSPLWIRNESFSDGRKYVQSNPKTMQLEDLIFEKYIRPSIRIKIKEEEVLDEILTGIGDLQYVRDKKLNQILESDEKEKEKEKDNNFFKKIFK
jgi:hypothetical protein